MNVVILVMHGLQITELKQLFSGDDVFIAYGSEKFHNDDVTLDLAGTFVTLYTLS